MEFKWFYFILFNLFMLKPIKTDFVLTTLATRSDNSWQKRHIRNQCRFWSRVATYLIDPSKQNQHDSARVGTSNAKAGPNMEARKGFIPGIMSTSRWRLAVRAKGPLAEDAHWDPKWKRTTDHTGIQNATKAQRIIEFSAAHRARNTLAARIWFPFFLEK